MNNIQQDIAAIVGEGHIITDPDTMAPYATDQSKLPGNPLLVAIPSNKRVVSEILSYCNNRRIGVVPSGGRTGLAGGSTANAGEIILSMEKLNRIEAVDPVNMCVTVEAGAITELVQRHARDAGYCFPIDLAARGTCQIGGNIATNAGGMKVLRYGMTRENILGLEVILADGSLLDLNHRIYKNNTGYDLKHLFIGSEGTLGVITAATLRLTPLIHHHALVLLATDSTVSLMRLLETLRNGVLPVSACELVLQNAFEFMLKHGGIRDPFATRWPFYCFVEFELRDPADADRIETLTEPLLLNGTITDGVRATNAQEIATLWKIRENISETVGRFPHLKKHDVALPIGAVGDFLQEFAKLALTVPPSAEIVLFGHLGDGNLHINLVEPGRIGDDEFELFSRSFSADVFQIVARFNGSISAEHGIGMLKMNDLHYSRSQLEISLMRKIKSIFDPHWILNSGKIFSPECEG